MKFIEPLIYGLTAYAICNILGNIVFLIVFLSGIEIDSRMFNQTFVFGLSCGVGLGNFLMSAIIDSEKD